MSEALNGFCRHGTNLLAFTSVAVQVYLCVDWLSPYACFIESSGAVPVYPLAVICPEGRNALQKP
jgi:hypothetical protein